MRKTLTILATLLFAATVLAQGSASPGGGGQPPRRRMGNGMMTMLLMDPEVSAELKISEDQKKKLMGIGSSIQEKMQQAMQDAGGDQSQMQKLMRAIFEDMAKKQLEVLTPEQKKRLQEIFVQDNGVGAVADKEIQKALGFTDDQSKKVATLQDGLMNAMRSLGQKMQNQEITFADFQSLMEKNQKTFAGELGKILTEDQKKKLKAMEGKPFKRKGPAGGGPMGGPPGGGPGGGPGGPGG